MRTEKKKNKTSKGAVIALAVTTGILAVTSTTFGCMYFSEKNQATASATQIENVYKKNYYELVDNANTIDTNISKLLASIDENYQAKMLRQISAGAKEMQSNVAALPLSGDGILESVKFINQMSGYTQILEEKIESGENLDEDNLSVLEQMHDSLTQMKIFLNDMSQKMLNGYNISQASRMMDGDFDKFSLDLQQIKSDGTEYPSMIYDGPFSDSVVNKEVKGLSGENISKEQAFEFVQNMFDNISTIQYSGQAKGRFETYNFRLTNSNGQVLFVQVTKQGGKLLTINGNQDVDEVNIDENSAKDIASEFAKNNCDKNLQIVWSEAVGGEMFFNFASLENNVVIYPDLVKIKVDLKNGYVIGFDAMSYWTNHVERNVESGRLSVDDAQKLIDESFDVVMKRLSLVPLDYNREVLCWEFECNRNGATYYIYLNAQTGEEENILKVVKTDDGSKLM